MKTLSDVFPLVRKIAVLVADDNFPSNLDEVMPLAVELDDMTGAFRSQVGARVAPPWTSLYRPGMQLWVKNAIDAFFVHHIKIEKCSEKLAATYERWLDYDAKLVLLFNTMTVLGYALRFAKSERRAFDFVEKFFGDGDVLHGENEQKLLMEARKHWHGSD